MGILQKVGADKSGQWGKRLNTALHVAAKKGCCRCVDKILQAGARADQINRQRWTPLHFAAKHGHDRCVSSLIAAGADI